MASDHPKYLSLNNWTSPARPALANIEPNEILYYPFIVYVSKCCGSCYTVDDPYAWICFPNKVNDMSIKVLN